MSDIVRFTTNAGRGRAVIRNGIAFFGGHVADDRTQDIRGQVTQALAKLDRSLALVGTDKTRLLSAQIWLKDITSDFAIMNDVWDAWLSPEDFPARASAQCLMGAPDCLVEIIVTAAV